MLKTLGLILVATTLTGAGFLGAQRVKDRYERLKNICIFIREATDRIRMGKELFEIVDNCGQKAGIYTENHILKIDSKGLNTEDAELFENFVSQLGMGDTESQLKRCETYLFLMRKNENSAYDEAKTKTSLYGKLGFFAGLTAAIILI